MLNSKEMMEKIVKMKELKRMGFDAGCVKSKGHESFSQKYSKVPEILFSTNGLSISITDKVGAINHVFKPKINTTGFEVEDLFPVDKTQQYPVCYLVVPPYD